MSKIFYINNRFSVNAELNLLKELETAKEHRLEPRLISLLCMLSENAGQLTSRELLISKIWNDYGGAEDSLNQAISFLRKALHDPNKALIETVPKKGYILHATISNDADVVTSVPKPSPSVFKYRIAWVAAIFVVLLAGYFFVYRANTMENKETPSNHSQDARGGLEVNFSDLKPVEEDASNTITTTGPDGVRYRVVAIGDKKPELYVNDSLVSDREREKYSDIEDQMLRRLWERQKSGD